MDKLHRLASGEGENDLENGFGGDEQVFRDFARSTAAIAKEGLREGLSHGKELDMQQGFNAGYRTGIEIGLVIGGAKALVEKRPTLNDDPLLSGLASAGKPDMERTEKSDLLALPGDLAEIAEDLRILKEFVSEKLVPNPNDSCCGGGKCGEQDGDVCRAGGDEGDCRGDIGNRRGSEEGKGHSLLLLDPSKDQIWKAQKCLDFAQRLRSKMDISLGDDR